MTHINENMRNAEVQSASVSGRRILENKCATVFGAAGSIGAAVAKEFAAEGARVFLAGRINGNIGGYLTAHAIDGTAYIDSVVLATEALPTNIGTGLVFELMQICRRSQGIREVCYGLDAPEDVSLGKFKDGMGFSAVKVLARVGMVPGLKTFIQWRRPTAYYRLFGK